jgi:hypothetical protein
MLFSVVQCVSGCTVHCAIAYLHQAENGQTEIANGPSLRLFRILAKALVCVFPMRYSMVVSLLWVPIACTLTSLLASESHCHFVAYVYCHVLFDFPLAAYQACYTNLLCAI